MVTLIMIMVMSLGILTDVEGSSDCSGCSSVDFTRIDDALLPTCVECSIVWWPVKSGLDCSRACSNDASCSTYVHNNSYCTTCQMLPGHTRDPIDGDVYVRKPQDLLQDGMYCLAQVSCILFQNTLRKNVGIVKATRSS